MPSRKPPATPKPISLEGFYPHFDLEDCLVFVGRAMERAGWEERHLPEYQRSLFHDLHNPLDEETLADMLAPWKWDWERLHKRGRKSWEKLPARPRIDVFVEITSKGNLVAEWFPRDGTLFFTPEDSDFVQFARYRSRTVQFGGRPTNELFFLHGVETALHLMQHAGSRPFAALDTVLLSATARVVGRVKERLKHHFDLRMMSDVFLTWERDDCPGYHVDEWRSAPERLAKWEIDDPTQRLLRAELAELEQMEQQLGFSEADIVAARQELETRPAGKTGPPPSPHTLSERLTRELKKRGKAATKGKVERALTLIDRHRQPVRSFSDNVIALRPPVEG